MERDVGEGDTVEDVGGHIAIQNRRDEHIVKSCTARETLRAEGAGKGGGAEVDRP